MKKIILLTTLIFLAGPQLVKANDNILSCQTQQMGMPAGPLTVFYINFGQGSYYAYYPRVQATAIPVIVKYDGDLTLFTGPNLNLVVRHNGNSMEGQLTVLNQGRKLVFDVKQCWIPPYPPVHGHG